MELNTQPIKILMQCAVYPLVHLTQNSVTWNQDRKNKIHKINL